MEKTLSIPSRITKRSGNQEAYDSRKIREAIRKSFLGTDTQVSDSKLDALVEQAEALIIREIAAGQAFSVEFVQDKVEQALMEADCFPQAKAYILYRETRRRLREDRQRLLAFFPDLPPLAQTLAGIERDFPAEPYSLGALNRKFQSLYKEDRELEERVALLVRAALELTDKEASRWEMIAGRLYSCLYHYRLEDRVRKLGINSYPEKMRYLDREGLLAKSMLETYSQADLEEAYQLIQPERDHLLPYSGLDLLVRRYVIHDRKHRGLESIQEMYLNIALFLAIPEKPDMRLYWVKRFYDMLSLLLVTMATPTLTNARKPYHQLSSCFIDTVPDDLQGIYHSISNFANVSKFGGGMGLYFGKVRAHGSDIRGFEGAAGGVIRWIRLANDTAVAVDQGQWRCTWTCGTGTCRSFCSCAPITGTTG